MFVIWKLVTKAVSAAFGVITRPEVVCVFSVVVALVTLGWCRTRLTVIVAVAVGPPRPAAEALVDSWTVKLPEAVRTGRRRELESRGSLGDGDELAVGDLRYPVIQVQRSAGDVRDLEVGHERRVERIRRDHQTGSRLRIVGGRGVGDARLMENEVDGDGRGRRRTAQAGCRCAGRLLDGEAARWKASSRSA